MERLLADAQKLTGVKYDINNLGDVYNAIHAIQGELGLTGVAAEEAKTTLSGSAGAMKASWENLLAAMMTGEGVEEAMAQLSESVGYFSENVLSMLGNVAPHIPDLVMGIFNTLISNSPALLEGGIELLGQIALGFVESFPVIVSKIPELFNVIFTAVSEADWASIGQKIINAVWEGMKSIWGSVADWFQEKVSSLNGTAYIDVYTRQYGASVDETGTAIPKLASGMNYVPYDEFPALLHEGEMVVPASLASQLRAAGISSDTKSFGGGGTQAVAVTNNVKIAFEGSLSQLAQVLLPYITVEQERVGPQLIS